MRVPDRGPQRRRLKRNDQLASLECVVRREMIIDRQAWRDRSCSGQVQLYRWHHLPSCTTELPDSLNTLAKPVEDTSMGFESRARKWIESGPLAISFQTHKY